MHLLEGPELGHSTRWERKKKKGKMHPAGFKPTTSRVLAPEACDLPLSYNFRTNETKEIKVICCLTSSLRWRTGRPSSAWWRHRRVAPCRVTSSVACPTCCRRNEPEVWRCKSKTWRICRNVMPGGHCYLVRRGGGQSGQSRNDPMKQVCRNFKRN